MNLTKEIERGYRLIVPLNGKDTRVGRGVKSLPTLVVNGGHEKLRSSDSRPGTGWREVPDGDEGRGRREEGIKIRVSKREGRDLRANDVCG